jgi:hypothetical protein
MSDELKTSFFHSSLITHYSSLLYLWRFVLFAVVWILVRQKFTGPSVLCQKPQGIAQNLTLKLAHKGAAQTVSHLESFRIERARRAHLRGDFRADRDENCRDAAHLDFALDRNDRAVTDVRSTSRQHDRIGARPLINLVGNLRLSHFIHGLELHRVAHVADVFLRHTADEAFGH